MTVLSGGDFLVSRATFPAYFLKDAQSVENARCDLDLTLFGQQIAVSPAAEGQDVCARIVTALVQEAMARGIPYPFLFTKPNNVRVFRSLGFYPVVETTEMVMLSRQRDALRRFLTPLPQWKEGITGCVVCHANPFTLGHLHLITTAAQQCDHVLVFVLAEESGPFPAADRLSLVQ